MRRNLGRSEDGKDTWPDLSTRQGFIEAIEQAGQYIRDHASNLLGEYPSLLCEFDITARFRFDAVPTVEIRREHIAAPLDKIPATPRGR